MSSLTNKLIHLLMRVTRANRDLSDAALLERSIAQDRRLGPPAPGPLLHARLDIRQRTVAGMTVFTLRQKQHRSSGPVSRVIYLHGGAYVFNLNPLHWQFAAWLAGLGCEVTLPAYPLAPEQTCAECVPAVLAMYCDLLNQTPGHPPVLIGDSAGGGLSLALAQSARDAGLPQPAHIVLISPWLDVTMTHPGIAEVAPLDPLLGIDGLVSAGRKYAGSLDPAAPPASPIHGRLDGLAPMTLFIGTHDLLLPDARRFRDLAQAQAAPLDYVETPEALHDWVLFSMPESKLARAKIKGIVTGCPE